MQPHLQERPADPPGVIKLYLINAARLLAWGAYSALVYVCLLRGLELTRDTSVPLIIGKVLFWEIKTPVSIWFPLFPVAFFLAALLPLATKYCIGLIVSIKGEDPLSRWAKGILSVITLACIVSTLTATGPLMIESSSGKYREAAVKGELVEARKGAELQIYADMQTSLQTMKEGKSVEAAAAREGVAGWSAKVAIAKKQLDAGQLTQERFDRIERAGSRAAAAEAMQVKMQEQQVKIASLPTASTAVSSVKSDESHGAQEFAEMTSAWWPFISFFALEMIAVFFGLIQLVLELTRDRQLADWEAVHAQPTAEAGIDTLAIEDQTDQWQVQPQDIQYDEYGNELVKVRRRKEEYYRRKAPAKKPKKDDPRAAQMFDGLPEEGQNLGDEVSDAQGLQSEINPVLEAARRSNEDGAAAHQDNLDAESQGVGELRGDGEKSEIVAPEIDTKNGSDEIQETASDGFDQESPSETDFEAQENDVDAGEFSDEEGSLENAVEPLQDGSNGSAEGLEGSGIDAELTEPREYTEDEIAELEREWRARRGLPAPTEAAE